MKIILKILLALVFLAAAYFLGIYVEAPKQTVNHELESRFAVLDGYRKWGNREIQLKPAPAYESSGVLCGDGSLPTYRLYSGFGNPRYASGLVGGSFDGYFWSVHVVECPKDYYIEDGDPGKYYGPFTFDTKYNY